MRIKDWFNRNELIKNWRVAGKLRRLNNLPAESGRVAVLVAKGKKKLGV